MPDRQPGDLSLEKTRNAGSVGHHIRRRLGGWKRVRAASVGQLVPSHMQDNMTVAGIFVFAGLGYLIYYLVALRAAKGE